MSLYPQHRCSLSIKGSTGLPRLAPNVTWFKRCCRTLRKMFLLNPRHQKCKKLFRNNASIVAERKGHATGRYFFVIHPLSTFNSILEAMFFVTWMFSIIFEPFQKFVTNQKVWHNAHVVVSQIKLLLILLFFNIGYLDRSTRNIVIQPKKIILRYLKSFFFFDILTVTHMLDHIFMMTSNTRMEAEFLKSIFYILRIFANCIRIGTLLKSLKECLINMRFKKVARSIILHIIKSYLCVHLWSFVIYMVPTAYYINKLGKYPRKSWVVQSRRRVKSKKMQTSGFFRYIDCFLMTFCYFFGITYMYEILVPIEQLCFALLSLFGRLYTLFLLADILNLFGIIGVSEGMYENRMAIITQYMLDKDIPDRSRQRILKFCEFKFQGRYFKENRILYTLSRNLRTEIFLFSARNVIHKVDIFRKLPNFTLGLMMASMRSETFSSNDLIMKIGSEVDDIHFISTGTVAVVNSRDHELCHLEDGDVYGTSCLFIKKQVYAIVAVETTEVFIISKEDLLNFFRSYPEVMVGFLRTVKLKLDRIKHLDDLSDSGVDIISELQRGRILEGFAKRIYVSE